LYPLFDCRAEASVPTFCPTVSWQATREQSPRLFTRSTGALAPVHAVRGNVDHGAWSANLPVTQRIEIDGFRIYVLHILAELDPQAADNAVIYGHSHQPKIETKNGTLFFNPGSAGPRRFGLPITVGRVTAEHGKLRAEIVELSVEHHRRSIRRRRQRR
jgi:putative phosphoesterase